MNSPQTFIFLPLLILYFTSCNYKSGLTKKSENYNIRLDVINNSKAIQLSPVLNRILKDEIAKYPEIKLADSKVEKSDYSVELRLDSYRLSPESYLAEDTLVANSLKANFNVRMKVKDNNSRDIVLERDYSFFAGSSASPFFDHQHDRQLQVYLARDLSKKITRDLMQVLH